MNGVALAIPSKKESFMRYEEKKVFIDNMLKQVEDVPVEHVIGRRISLKRNGNHFSGFCPFHTSSSKKLGSFMVTPGKNIGNVLHVGTTMVVMLLSLSCCMRIKTIWMPVFK